MVLKLTFVQSQGPRGRMQLVISNLCQSPFIHQVPTAAMRQCNETFA